MPLLTESLQVYMNLNARNLPRNSLVFKGTYIPRSFQVARGYVTVNIKISKSKENSCSMSTAFPQMGAQGELVNLGCLNKASRSLETTNARMLLHSSMLKEQVYRCCDVMVYFWSTSSHR